MSRKDINLSFKRHPITKDITALTDKTAIDQSVRNIVLHNYNERKRLPSFGTNTNALLFEAPSILVAQTLKTDITNALNTFEPDIEVITIHVSDPDRYSTINVSVIYTYRNDPTEQTTLVSLSS